MLYQFGSLPYLPASMIYLSWMLKFFNENKEEWTSGQMRDVNAHMNNPPTLITMAMEQLFFRLTMFA